MITWLENPLNYSYLRKSTFMSGSPRVPIRTVEKRQDYGKIVGYEKVSSQRYMYLFNFYWLKEHDRDLMPDGVYKGPKEFGGKMPAEAKNPVELVKDNPYMEVSHETNEQG